MTIINRLLTDIRTILEDQEEFKYLDLLDDDTLPQYSDVVLILSQYDKTLSRVHYRYSHYDSSKSGRVWNTDSDYTDTHF